MSTRRKTSKPSSATSRSSVLVSSRQAFSIESVERSALKGAPYNPRQISKEAARKLRANLERVGLVAPITWNRRTGNVLGGHQRLAALDAIEGGTDYALDVAVVDLDETTEREQCVFLNNASSQGEWDAGLLEELLRELPEINIDSLGFDAGELDLIVEAPDLSALTLENASPETRGMVAETGATLDEIAEMKAKRKAWKAERSKKDAADCYVTVVFESADACEAELKRLGLEGGERYVPFATFAERVRRNP